MVGTVYLLCTLVSLFCSVLLFRGYRGSGFRLLLWSSICFLFMTLDNLFLFLDRIVFPDLNMVLWRRPFALVGLVFLVYGMVWEDQR